MTDEVLAHIRADDVAKGDQDLFALSEGVGWGALQKFDDNIWDRLDHERLQGNTPTFER